MDLSDRKLSPDRNCHSHGHCDSAECDERYDLPSALMIHLRSNVSTEKSKYCHLSTAQHVEPYLSRLMTVKDLESLRERCKNERDMQEQRPTELSQARTRQNRWCECGNYPAMSTEKESVCCKKVLKTLQRMGSHRCITDHPSFSVVCLDPEVLQTVLVAMRDRQFEDLEACTKLDLALSSISAVHLMNSCLTWALY